MRGMLTLALLAIIAVGLAVFAGYGKDLMGAYWQGRADLVDARARAQLTDASADQVRAVTRIVEAHDRRQAALVALLAGVVVVQPLVLLSLLRPSRRPAAPVVRVLSGGRDADAIDAAPVWTLAEARLASKPKL